MILWCDAGHPARENMRRDAELLARVASGGIEEPVLRVFRFRPAGITLGRSQDPARELDLERVRAAGFEWAVRPTGGRAIFHDEEWTFSLATRLGPGQWARRPSAAYERSCEMLSSALHGLGVPVELSAGSARGSGSPRATGGAAAPCFASTARHELTLGGRKLCGIAQRAVHGALLQQGSLLLGDSHLRLVDFQRLDDAQREAARAGLRSASAHAGKWLGTAAALERFAEALAPHVPGYRRVDGPGGDATLGLFG